MNILMLSPEPFFSPRGTPISIFFRLKALSDLGHSVDLITYPSGADVMFKNLKIRRVPNLFLTRRIRIGPSLGKIPLDFLLSITAVLRMRKSSYDLIFTHEEAAWLGVVLAKAHHLPHLYDMHSSLPNQMNQHEHEYLRWLRKPFLWLENLSLKNAAAVLVICPELLKYVREKGFGGKAVLIENFVYFEEHEGIEDRRQSIRNDLAPDGEKIILYSGNFRPYQGLCLLLEAAAEIDRTEVVFVLVGSRGKDGERTRKRAERLNISHKVRFIQEVPPDRIPDYLSAADVLVSPRLTGNGTPLKIYSYLRSGTPIVATNITAHSQILDEQTAILVDPDRDHLAEGLSFALSQPEARRRALEAKQRADREYTYPRYLEKMNRALQLALSTKGRA